MKVRPYLHVPYMSHIGPGTHLLHSDGAAFKKGTMRKKLPAFDVLVDMARNDPIRLENLRQKLTMAVINSATTQDKRRRLEGLQFRVDMERQRARSPLAAAIRVSEMMCHSLGDLHRSMVTPFADEEIEEQPEANAVVLTFKPRSVED